MKQHRTSRDLTQQTVADNACISVTYVGLIEQGQRGRKPSRDVTQRLCEALGLSVYEAEELFRAAGFLESGEALHITQNRDPVCTVAEAIEMDALLSEQQKKLLLDLYDKCTTNKRNGHTHT